MGTGEEALGKALMKAFLFALTKQDTLPSAVLLYNSGAYLSCESSDSLEDLQALHNSGVEILTCGTCLDFYHLKDRLMVGGVTNMYTKTIFVHPNFINTSKKPLPCSTFLQCWFQSPVDKCRTSRCDEKSEHYL